MMMNTKKNIAKNSIEAVLLPVKIECILATKEMMRKNPKYCFDKALTLVKDLFLKYKDPLQTALIYHTRAYIYMAASGATDDLNVEHVEHLETAVKSARMAVRLSPSSVEFARFYATLLYMTAREGNEYEEVVRECERFLAIENPIDPSHDSFSDKFHKKNTTPEARIAYVQNKLRSIIRKSNIKSILTWKMNLGNGDKFRVTPIKSNPELEVDLGLVQTPEERRKEIEERVAASRLLQLKSESPNLVTDVDSGRRGKVRKNTSSGEWWDSVRSYWNSLSSDRKKDFLRVKISDLKAYVNSSKGGGSTEVFNEALSFGEANKMWKFWICCLCDKKFSNPCSIVNHVVCIHMGRPSLVEEEFILPQKVTNEWVEMIRTYPWKPLELNDAEPILKDDEWKNSDEDQSLKKSSVHKNWPLSIDPERSKLLETIHVVLHALIKHEYLASSHLKNVIQFALKELRGLEGGLQLLNSNVDQTPICICLLGAPELKKILEYLQEISHACGLSKRPNESNAPLDFKTGVQRVDITEKVTFSQDCSFLVLDEHSLPCIPRASCNDPVSGHSSAATSSHIIYGNGVVLDSDALLAWIFTGPSTGEQVATWTCVREEKTELGLETFVYIQDELCHLQRLCEKKTGYLSYEQELQFMEILWLEEVKKREEERRNYVDVLKERQEELIEKNGNQNDPRNRIKVDAIKNVLKDAACPFVNQSGVGSCIEVTIQRQKEQVSIQIGKIDAVMMQMFQTMHQLEVSHDFLPILVPLMKSYLQACLKDLAEKDATEKANAAREELLAGVDAGVHHSKNVNGMTKKKKSKKKSKKKRENKDAKATSNDESHDQNQAVDKILLPGACDSLRLKEDENNLEAVERKPATVAISDAYLRHNDDDKDATERCANKKEEEFDNILEGVTESTLNAATPRAGLSNEGSPQDGGVWSEVRSRRRSRRCEGPKISIHGTSEKEESDAGPPKLGKNSPADGDDGAKTLIPLLGEDDSEEKFQDDLNESPGTSHARQESPSLISTSVLPEISDCSVSKFGEYNSFLNVIIQSLWHLQRFRDEFFRRPSSEHAHVGDPCAVCALYDIFTALTMVSAENRKEAVDPSSLQVALSNLHLHTNFFLEGQLNDASDVVEAIFYCLHLSFTLAPVMESADASCISHTIFGMDIFERMKRYNCGLDSRNQKYISFVHYIKASALRTKKVKHPKNSFGELLNQLEMDRQLAYGGCQKLDNINRHLSTTPHVFTAVLEWQKTCESLEDIMETLAALSTDIDINALFDDLDEKKLHCLVSVVCYYDQHYKCFAYRRDLEKWVICDDKTVKVIGGWSDVLMMCEKGLLQPQILFFEAVN